MDGPVLVPLEKLTLTIPEAAKMLGISKNKMYDLARSAGFPTITVGTRRLISRKGLERWMEIKTEQAMKDLLRASSCG